MLFCGNRVKVLKGKNLPLALIIAMLVWFIWWLSLGYDQGVGLLKENIEVVLTMILGSFVAGSTSVGGGAVAFPVFTKILSIDSQTALIFSLAIQSVGMTAASIVFFYSRTPLCFRVIAYGCFFGSCGLLISLFGLRHWIVGAEIKYIFSCFSLFVALALSWDRWVKRSLVKSSEQLPSIPLLVIGSFLGGLLSGIIGVGIDFIVFSLMVFVWHYDFKKATATSVVVMASNALVGFVALLIFSDYFTETVKSYWLSAVPIVVLGAPLGALACKYLPKTVLFYFLLVLVLFDVASTIFILGFKWEFFVFVIVSFLAFILIKVQQEKNQTSTNC